MRNSMLCKAQNAFQTSSHLSMIFVLRPYRKMQKRPFMIPKFHSTYFLINSSHSKNLMHSCAKEWFIGDTVFDHAKYALHAMNHNVWHCFSKTSPAVSCSKMVNLWSLNNLTSCAPLINVSHETMVLSFHLAGCPGRAKCLLLMSYCSISCAEICLQFRPKMINLSPNGTRNNSNMSCIG